MGERSELGVQFAAMTATKDEARVDRIRAVINALNGRGSNSAGVQKELLPAALVGFFLDELREQFAELRELLENQAE
jgi:hypothetical protein